LNVSHGHLLSWSGLDVERLNLEQWNLIFGVQAQVTMHTPFNYATHNYNDSLNLSSDFWPLRITDSNQAYFARMSFEGGSQ
jgi:hypothetical protein